MTLCVQPVMLRKGTSAEPDLLNAPLPQLCTLTCLDEGTDDNTVKQVLLLY